MNLSVTWQGLSKSDSLSSHHHPTVLVWKVLHKNLPLSFVFMDFVYGVQNEMESCFFGLGFLKKIIGHWSTKAFQDRSDWLQLFVPSQSENHHVSVTGINLVIWWNLANLGLTKKFISHHFWCRTCQLTEWSCPAASKESPTTVAIGFQINEPIQLEICVITAAKSIPDGSAEAQDGGILARLAMAPLKLWPRS